uniref:Uncharacterized protein n=1 Tax=Anguilla anguilla TaxID=7936 RepID=A0A0E9W4L2_ANGAN
MSVCVRKRESERQTTLQLHSTVFISRSLFWPLNRSGSK